jgi:alpha-L-rhamnosidase
MLSSGWWNDMATFSIGKYNYFGDRQSLLAKIEITYSGGTTETIVTTTKGWQYYGNGPIRYGAFFNGENYDATLEAATDGWSEPGYDASAWASPEQITPKEAFADPQVVAQIGNGVKAVETITAASYSEPRQGVYVYDMGVNMVGVPRVTLTGESGQVVTLRTGEILYPDLAEYTDINGVSLAGMILTENLRGALSTDTYICKGDPDGETYQPRFTFHGYRYLEITGIDEPLPVENVQGVVLSSLTEMTGHYETSNELVNQLYKNILRSQYGNFLSIPTDCPQRDERMGWTGDAQVFARTATFNANVDQFYSRFTQILRDGQNESDGMYPTFAPSYGDEHMIGLAWPAAGVIIPWEVYQQYGDTRIIEENYASMKAFMDGLAANTKPGFSYLTDSIGGLADHLAYVETDVDMLGNTVYVSMIRFMARMAAAIGNESDAAAYSELYENAKTEWNATYVDASTHLTRAADGTLQDTQSSYSLPLSYDLFSDEHAVAAAARLAEISENLGYIVTTGFIGTAPLNPTLSDYGYDDVAYRLLESTDYPSWLYPVINGATSIWERWNSYTVEDGFGGNNGMNSFNHYSLGAVGAWMYNYSLGIQRDSENPGFKHFILQPRFGGTMTFARGYYDSMYGRIEAAWELDGNDFLYTITVPANTTATMYLPATSEDNVYESGLAVSNAEGVTLLRVEENKIVYELQSGIYEFRSDLSGL